MAAKGAEMRDTLPARAKRTGNRRLSVEFGEDTAAALELHRRQWSLRSWGATIRHLIISAETLESALQDVGTKWLAIETAPKGQYVLIYSLNSGFSVAHFHEPSQRWEAWPGWFDITPTHWMPLPERPKQCRS